MTPKFKLDQDFRTVHLPQVSSSFTCSEVIVLTIKHTNTQTPLKKTSNAVHYATTLGNYIHQKHKRETEKPAIANKANYAFYDLQQEMKWPYSYNAGAHCGHTQLQAPDTNTIWFDLRDMTWRSCDCL